VVIEATTNTWTLYDVTLAYVSKVVVAHPLEVKQIANARVKTDKHDVNCLARLLVADLVPEVWVPPMEVRELRTLIAHRRRLIKMRTMTHNRLHSVVHRNNLVPPEGGFFCRQEPQLVGRSVTLSGREVADSPEPGHVGPSGAPDRRSGAGTCPIKHHTSLE